MAKDVKNEIEEAEIINDPLYDAVEVKRKEFSATYKKYKTLSMVILGITFAAMVGSAFLMLVNVWIALVVIIAILAGSFVFSNIRKKKMDALTNEFIEYYYNTINAYCYNDNVNFNEISGHAFEKIKPEEFVTAGFVQNVTHIGSRNCVYGKIAGLDFKSCDCVARVTTNNVTETAFLGEYYQIQLDKIVTGKTLIYFGPEAQNGAGPNDLDGLNEIKDIKGLNDNIRVWSSCKQIDKLITPEVIKAINAFEPNKVLEDVCFCIKSNACYVALSYTDELMVLPLLEKFKLDPQKQHKEDVAKLAVVAKALRKNVLNNEFVQELLGDEEEKEVASDAKEASVEEVKEESKE